jgi:hypothetical protein
MRQRIHRGVSSHILVTQNRERTSASIHILPTVMEGSLRSQIQSLSRCLGKSGRAIECLAPPSNGPVVLNYSGISLIPEQKRLFDIDHSGIEKILDCYARAACARPSSGARRPAVAGR